MTDERDGTCSLMTTLHDHPLVADGREQVQPPLRLLVCERGSTPRPSVPIPKFATTLPHAPERTSESTDPGKSMILVPLLNPKFATHPAAILGELRVRGTSQGGIRVSAGSRARARGSRRWRAPIHGCP